MISHLAFYMLLILDILYLAYCIYLIKHPSPYVKKKLDEMERRFNEGDILGNKDFFRKKPWYITEKVEIIRYTRLKSMYSSHVGEIAEASYIPNRQSQNSRDTVYIAFEKTGCYISQVPEQYEPRWSGKLSIEYRKKFGYVPDKKTREAVRELAGFLMGRDLKLIGRTEYSKSGFAIRAMAQNPQSVNIVKVCRLCNQEIVPVHIYGNESLNFKETMEQLLPRYLHSDMRDVIQKTLPLYWSSFVLYVDNAIPVIASAIETLQKAWFALEENESVSVYYPKTKFRELKKDLIAIIDEKLEEGPYKNAVRNKVDQLNQMSVRDKNESFFAQLGITYGEREIQAIRMRNVFAHGDTNGKTDAGNMIEAIKVLQLLYAKSVLKLLGYEGEYIDWCDGGTRKTVY